MMTKVKSSVLQLEDAVLLPDEDQAKNLLNKYELQFGSIGNSDPKQGENVINVEGQGKFPGTVKVLWRLFWKRLSLYFIGEVIYSVIATCQPLFLKELVEYLEKPDDQLPVGIDRNRGILYAVLLGGFAVMLPLFHHYYWFGVYRLGAQARVVLNTLIFKKLLRLSSSGTIQESGAGKAVNLISNDSFKIEAGIMYHPFLVLGPIQAIAVILLLMRVVGWIPALAGAFGMVLMIPLQLAFAKKFSEFRKQTLPNTDERIKTMKEALSGVEIMKLYNWEKPIIEKINSSRQGELRGIRSSALLQAVNQAFFFVSIIFVTFLTLITYSLIGNILNPSIVFFTLAVLDVLRVPLMLLVPYSIQNLGESLIATRRIDSFMNTQENAYDRTSQKSNAVSIENGTFTWSDENDPVLVDINLNFPVSSFSIIAGPLGSSKSSLFSALIGELKILKGKIFTPQKISYASQKPWIFTGTLRENILFNQKYDQERYGEVLRVCELNQDFEQFKAGDLTIIGERGVNLSGGQKARVSLARSLYYDADLYLLDDPLSAVDPIVGKRIIENCVGKNSFLKSKTRILITHQLQFRNYADYIVVLEKGSVVFQGIPSEYTSNNLEETLEVEYEDAPLIKNNAETKVNLLSPKQKQTEKNDESNLIVAEDRAIGSVSSKIYASLFKLIGYFPCIVSSILIIGAQVSLFSIYFFFNYWSLSSASDQTLNRARWVGISAGLVLLTLILAFMSCLYYFHVMVRSASNFHESMLKSVLFAPIRFFESNPLGRILNRFSRDQATVDEFFPMTSYDFVRCTVSTFGGIILVLTANAWVLIAMAVILPLFWYIRQKYVTSSREIKRLDGIAKSPIFEHFASSLEGLVSIRAFSMQGEFLNTFMQKIDAHNRVWFSYLGLARWIGCRMDYLVALILLSTSLSAVLAKSSIDPTIAALSLTYMIQITGTFQWWIRMSAEAENQMTSVERILSYCDLPREDSKPKDSLITPPVNWPSKGEFEMRNLKVRYREDLDYILKGVSVKINGMEKVGVCGRTGSGKSTWFKTCFRLIEPSEGSILIDGIDISTISLDDLRSKLSIIPQDPVLFSGTLRYNLDPFNTHTTEQVERVLEILNLKDVMIRLPQGLDTKIAEAGSNLSAGECQLICVARALLKPSKILFIDEATANIDKETDKLIQNVIRTHFKDRTVMVIAHRLDTIIDSDKIAVLNYGSLEEFGSPSELSQQDGIFASMISKSGIQIQNIKNA